MSAQITPVQRLQMQHQDGTLRMMSRWRTSRKDDRSMVLLRSICTADSGAMVCSSLCVDSLGDGDEIVLLEGCTTP